MNCEVKSRCLNIEGGDTPEVGRRRLLLGLAAGAAAVTALSGNVPKAKTLEDADLIALADGLPGVERDYLDAFEKRRKIINQVSATWPRAPKEIRRHGQHCTEERGVDGTAFNLQESEMRGKLFSSISIGKPEHFEDSIRIHKARIAHIMTTKSKRQLKFNQLWLADDESALPMAKVYWGEVERLKEESGFEEANGQMSAAREVLHAHVDLIMGFREKTMQGVVIKAMAMAAWGKVDPFHRALNIRANDWADAMAETVMRQAQQSA